MASPPGTAPAFMEAEPFRALFAVMNSLNPTFRSAEPATTRMGPATGGWP